MSLEVFKTKIRFCGKDRKFQDCKNKTIKEYQERIEKIQEDAKPLTDEIESYDRDVERLNRKIDNIDKIIFALEDLEEPSDKDLRDIIKLTDKKENLEDTIDEIFEEVKNKEENYKVESKKLDDLLDKELATLASLVLKDIKFEDYFEEAEPNDKKIAMYLPMFYNMAVAGAKQKDIDKKYKEIILGDDNQFQDRRNRR
ncbi:hypothetical protein [Methanobrevibacter sp. DSM 116169]|uniref:hypothetical protein n=1 Tax=Methanobrevibacter sp. DSM 116169 TaxID=3242727 RepID=UPI0038FD1B2A